MRFFKLSQRVYTSAIPIAISLLLWFIPHPEKVDPKGWHLFAIFISTIFGIILKPLPMGAIAILALTASVITGTLTLQDALSGFSNEIVWLILFAFFISRGFIASGLGHRIAYKLISAIGTNSLGLGYAFAATDLIVAPMIPSLTARGGGIIYPLLKAIGSVFTGDAHDPKMKAFLTLSAFQCISITSAMFLTAMAGNPLIVKLAQNQGIEITWRSWALATSVPGLISLALVPYIIYRLITPTIHHTPHARDLAIEKLACMGPMKACEWITLSTFLLLIILWIFGELFHINPTAAAMLGICIFLCTGIVRWKDLLEDQTAWDTFIWFSVLVTLPVFLNHYGFTSWFSEWMVDHLFGLNRIIGFFLVSITYFFSHYLFAGSVGHISAMYVPFLLISIALGIPPQLAALSLGFLSSLFCGLTHYGSGPAPILFSTGFATIKQWWKVGAIIGLINLFIWLICGSLWWHILGIW